MRYILLALLLGATTEVVAQGGPFRGRIFGRPQCNGPDCNVGPSVEYFYPSIIQPAAAQVIEEPKPKPSSVIEQKPTPVPDAPASPPVIYEAKPAIHQAVDKPDNLFGVDWDRIKPEECSKNGKKITIEQAYESVGGQIPDDKGKLRLVCIGTAAECKPVIDAWNLTEEVLRSRVCSWFVPADHWSLKDTMTGELRFKADGKPTVYLLAPGGQSLHRQDGWTSAQDVEAIRKGVKAYDTAKDPDLRKTPLKSDPKKGPAGPGQDATVAPGIVALGALALILFLGKRRNEG